MLMYLILPDSDNPNIRSRITRDLKFHLYRFTYYENSVRHAADVISENTKVYGLYILTYKSELCEQPHLLAYAH